MGMCGSKKGAAAPIKKQKQEHLFLDQPPDENDLKDQTYLYKNFFNKDEGKDGKKKKDHISEEEKKLKLQKIEEEFIKDSKLRASYSLATRELQPSVHNEIKLAIRSEDLLKLHEFFQKKKYKIQEELSDEGYYWNALHFACHFDSKFSLEYLIKTLYSIDKNLCTQLINSVNYEGWTPLMVAANNGSLNCLGVLILMGGSTLDIKDRQNRNAHQIAVFNKHHEFSKLLNENHEKLKSFHADYFENFDGDTFIQNKDPLNFALQAEDLCFNEKDLESVNDDIKKEILELVKSKKNFEDKKFPHIINSISQDPFHSHFRTFMKCIWLRPNEIFNCKFSEIKLFDNIDPDDIKQGSLAICYFLSVLAGLAEFPQRVKNIFVNSELNTLGIYIAKFYFNGIPQHIVIDDYFPCNGDKRDPIFSKPNGKELWVLLLEKAYCKFFGNYGVTEFEVVDYAMEDILGVPSLGFMTGGMTPEELWVKLYDCDVKNFLVSATSKKTSKRSEGMVPSHAYTIISAFDVSDLVSGLKLFKLRNPWGNFEWKGQYSDNSPKWTESLKERVKFVNADDGIFFMTPEEVHANFSYMSVCYYHEDWIYRYYSYKTTEHQSKYLKLTISEDGDYYFRVHQENERYYREKDEDLEYPYCYSPLEFMLYGECEKNGGFNEIACGNVMRYFGRKSVSITKDGHVHLKKGIYYLRIKVHWIDPEIFNKFVFSTYSKTEVQVDPIDKLEGKKIMRSFYTNLGKTLPTLKTHQESIKHGFKWYNQHCLFYVENNKDEEIDVELETSKHANCYLEKRFLEENKKKFKFTVAAHSTEILYAKRIAMHLAVSLDYEFHFPQKHVDKHEEEKQEDKHEHKQEDKQEDKKEDKQEDKHEHKHEHKHEEK